MSLLITNTLSGKKETFQPLKPGKVGMYTCGPTVYGLTHIGNARPAAFFDVVRRFLEKSGYQVRWVMNYTDVDDKIINRARDEKTTWKAIADKFTTEYVADLKSLGVRLPNQQPKVSEHIPRIIALIEGLIRNQAAYVAEDGEVFFSVRSFPDYGKLSNKKIDDLLVGVRIAADEKKHDPLDFSLWKPQKAADEPAWESPWGKGRPGWHIECSAMAMELLGDTFDIHGGGLDLIHPHHENEIAQAEACTRKPFAKLWMHNNLISIQKEKMSKSLGNIFLTRDFIKKYTAETLRYLLLSVHYRSPVEFSDTQIRDIQAALHRVYSAKKKAAAVASLSAPVVGAEPPELSTVNELAKGFEAGWMQAMSDDFNAPKALAFVFDYVRAINALIDKKGFKPTAGAVAAAKAFVAQLESLSAVLNLFGEDAAGYLNALKQNILAGRGIDPAAIEAKISERKEARAKKDFGRSDAIRDELAQQGIEIKDTPTGTDWDVLP